jgi:thioredoxin-related protein
VKSRTLSRWAFYCLIATSFFVVAHWLRAPVQDTGPTLLAERTSKTNETAQSAAKQQPVSSTTQSQPPATQNLAWLTDLKKAQEEAKASHKLLLLDFTGSDWCGFCFQLDKAILSQPQFKDYASKNLVLMEVDFPRRKAQSIEIRKQNAQLAQRYQIVGFPTIVVLNGDGKTVWRYDGLFMDGIAAFLAELDKVHKG